MEDEFLKELNKKKPNYEKCEKMLSEGIDINKQINVQINDAENYLSEAMLAAKGEKLVPMIRFCLQHGFDVGKMDGRFGAECLKTIAFSSFDRHIVEAGRELIRAGAIDVSDKKDYDALDLAIIERDYAERFEHDYIRCNYFEALIRMLEALHEGDTEADFGTFHDAEGKTITHVYAAKTGTEGTFVDTDRHKNTFLDTLYFEYGDGFLAVDRYLGIWTSGRLPTGTIEDVSKHFKEIQGRSIKNITFDDHGRPIFYELRINMDSGRSISFETNSWETNVESEYRAFYNIVF